VNILRSEHLSLADQFAAWDRLHGSGRYGEAKWATLTSDRAATLENVLGGFDCAVEEVCPAMATQSSLTRYELLRFARMDTRCCTGTEAISRSYRSKQPNKMEEL
jgi:hypothetical protein